MGLVRALTNAYSGSSVLSYDRKSIALWNMRDNAYELFNIAARSMLCRIVVSESQFPAVLHANAMRSGPLLLWMDDHFIAIIGKFAKMEAVDSRPDLSLVPNKLVQQAGTLLVLESRRMTDQYLFKESLMRRMQ